MPDQTPSGMMNLSELTEEYLANRMVDKKKHFGSYLILAKRAWQKLFRNTLFQVQSVWLTVQAGTPYNYIILPPGCQRIFSVSQPDRHGLIQPLFYNNQLNILPIPVTQSCGCTSCQCSGLCDDLNSTIVTSQLMFTINGINYYKKTWIKTCPNGDVIQWQEIPVKKYNDFVGENGDYNSDFNNDFSQINPSMANFSIVTETFQTKVCSLAVAPCGCPLPTPENFELINTFCSCFMPFGFWTRRHERQPTFLTDVNPNHFGEVKISDDRTKIYYKPTRHHELPNEPLIPKFLQLNFQTNGLSCTDMSLFPDYCFDYMCADVDFRSKKFNSKYSLGEKKEAKYERNAEENDLILFLNIFNMQELEQVDDIPIKW